MKNKIIHRSIGTALVCCLLIGSSVFAQLQNNGVIKIHDQGVMNIFSNAYNFGTTPAATSTSRTVSTHGVLAFGASATYSGASNTHFINGYARTYGTAPFVAPVGDAASYAPVKIVAATTNGVDAAYFRQSPSTISTAKSTDIRQLSSVEYWKIEGANSKISLSWSASSNVGNLALTPSTDYLTIVGFDGTQWVEIPSYTDSASFLGGSSSVTSGSLTSLGDVNVSSYSAFTIASKQIASCFPVVTSSGNTKTWNGSTWSPNAPTINDPVIINAPFSGDLSCYSMVLNANYTLNDGNKLDVVDAITSNGTANVIMASEASLLQHNANAAAPTIVMTKITNPMRRFDYVFLSSPINSVANFFSDLHNPNKTAVEGGFGQQTYAAFYQLRTFDSAGLQAIDATVANTPLGRGFSATVDSQAPYSTAMTPGAWYNEKRTTTITTEGTANNGDIPVTVPYNGWVRIGNPYPSPINANKLLDAMGPNVRKTLYYWTFNSPRGNIAATSYNNADFATFNYSGGVAACQGCETPNGIIATMQSVLTKAISNTQATTFNLTNCLRDLNGNDNFFREAADGENGKFRLDLVGSENSFSQILVAYNATNGTLEFDNGYDSPRLAGISSELSSLIGTSKYAIQTRPGFTATDVVPLQLDKRTEETFSIALASSEGVFSTTPIYLHDKTLAVYHDLTTTSYPFVQTVDDALRFEVVYQLPLGVEEVASVSAFAFINQAVFSAQAQTMMSDIQLYDLSGRLIDTYSNVNATTLSGPFLHAQGVYVAKIKLDNGTIVTQKLINN